MGRLGRFTCTVAMIACAPRGEREPRSRVAVECGDLPAGIGALLRPRATIVLGDLPGTREVPELVGRIACHAAAKGEQVHLVLELPPSERERVQAFVRSRGELEDRIALIRGPFWIATEVSASSATLALLEHVRVWRAAGARIEVVPADEWSTDPRAAQAIVLALVDPGRTTNRTDNIALRIVAAGGERWACPSAGDCGRRSVAGAGDGSEPRVRWTEPPPGWDAVFYVGAVSPSAPALEPSP